MQPDGSLSQVRPTWLTAPFSVWLRPSASHAACVVYPAMRPRTAQHSHSLVIVVVDAAAGFGASIIMAFVIWPSQPDTIATSSSAR